MQEIFRITTSPDSPWLYLTDPRFQSGELSFFRGDSKAQLSPKLPFQGVLSEKASWHQFYNFAPGSLVLHEDAWESCMDMYYESSMGTELLAVHTPYGSLRVINPLDFVPVARRNGEIINSEMFYAPIFRIMGHPETDLFCLEGSLRSSTGFKMIYDKFDFKGLDFECVWKE